MFHCCVHVGNYYTTIQLDTQHVISNGISTEGMIVENLQLIITDLLVSLEWSQLHSGEEISDLLKEFPVRIGMITLLGMEREREREREGGRRKS